MPSRRRCLEGGVTRLHRDITWLPEDLTRWTRNPFATRWYEIDAHDRRTPPRLLPSLGLDLVRLGTTTVGRLLRAFD